MDIEKIFTIHFHDVRWRYASPEKTELLQQYYTPALAIYPIEMLSHRACIIVGVKP
jgi:hypothetical protein